MCRVEAPVLVVKLVVAIVDYIPSNIAYQYISSSVDLIHIIEHYSTLIYWSELFKKIEK